MAKNKWKMTTHANNNDSREFSNNRWCSLESLLFACVVIFHLFFVIF